MTIAFPIWHPDWIQLREAYSLLSKEAQAESGVVIDVGCGRRDLRSYFKRASSFVKFDRWPCAGDMVIGDAASLPFRDGISNMIILFQVLGDMPDLGPLMSELHRILNDKGQLVILETMCYPQHDLPDDYFRVMPEGLRYHAVRAGFGTVRIHYIGGLFTRFASLINHYLLGTLRRFKWLHGPVCLLIMISNISFHFADKLCLRPQLSESYVAYVTKKSEES